MAILHEPPRHSPDSAEKGDRTALLSRSPHDRSGAHADQDLVALWLANHRPLTQQAYQRDVDSFLEHAAVRPGAPAPRPDRWPRSPYWQWWYAVRARVLRGLPPDLKTLDAAEARRINLPPHLR